ncbi:hypothetical protein N7468_003084 [Penicillium chermesinum]|uniref:Nuclear speckle splicing regulatory protein 1 N-terminal domain-containing protein n=1 Tax=Penicillium chermesinum TaxID=63820 RepID=A0A9W9TR92_9EURO|nr:uncharacterized protein N7468_003084 [Penicillium chermesinum]KAJ5238465.1 hypothetical protein N7468_003084 [Penicillium chermesinum]
MAPQFSMGLNLPKKKPAGPKAGNPLAQKRKNIFDDESDEEQQGDDKDHPPKRKMQMGGGKPNLKPLNKNSVFADDEDEHEKKDMEAQKATEYGLNQAQSKKQPASDRDFTNLSTLHSSKKHAKEAEELDPSVYSYDEVYDSLHAKPKKTTTTNQSEVPKYMTNLLRSAEIRKRDQLRARERQLQREREEEGDEFADKESFVTSAYKAQQAEMRKVEEEEARREQEEEERRKQNGGAGMINFYKDMLSRGDAEHGEVVKAAEEAAQRVKAGEVLEETVAESEEKTDAQKAEELNSRGAHVVVNDEGQVVDKRQLLSAGLNVAPKPKATPPSAASKNARGPLPRPGAGVGAQFGRGAQRARQTELVAQQLEERARQEEEAEAARQKEIADRIRSKKSATDVSSAKERYLARKKEREEAAKAASASS